MDGRVILRWLNSLVQVCFSMRSVARGPVWTRERKKCARPIACPLRTNNGSSHTKSYPKNKKGDRWGLNPQPLEPQSSALPIELRSPRAFISERNASIDKSLRLVKPEKFSVAGGILASKWILFICGQYRPPVADNWPMARCTPKPDSYPAAKRDCREIVAENWKPPY